MRIILLAALCAYANAVTCADTDDGTVGAQEAVCAATGGVNSFFTVGAVDVCVVGAGDATDCTLAAGPCCTACATGYATCTAAAVGQTCSAGYGLATASTPGECTACNAGTTWNAAIDDAICADVAVACTGANYESVTPIANANRECAACNNDVAGAITSCTGAAANTAVTCAVGFGWAANECTACNAASEFNAADDATPCATHDATSCTASDWEVAGTASVDHACTACSTIQAGSATCNASLALTCLAGNSFDTGVCTACVESFVALDGVTASCTDWANKSADCTGFKFHTAGGTTADGSACTDCTANDDAGNATQTLPANSTGDGVWTCAAANATVQGWTCDAGFWNNSGACDPCAALAQADIDLVVNVADTDGYTVTCGNGTDQVAATVTCKATHVDTDGDATNGCEAVAATTTAAPTTTVAPTTTAAPSSADGSDTSPAFIVGTAIAGIALLL